jgi:hypothetical protein
MRTWPAVVLSLVACVTAATGSHAQAVRIQALAGLTVYDANGKKVGPVIATTDGFPIVALT